jgi:uncharacterized protein YijF (DUF1287 family)
VRALAIVVLTTAIGGGLANLGVADVAESLVSAARARTQVAVTYDGAYQKLEYPGGDVDNNIGVCTDLIIRSYRQLGVDLQQLVHEDMQASFNTYPAHWGLEKPDPNIDHRRVPNLATFFGRQGQRLPVSDNPSDFQAGDIVTWTLQGRLPHIGLVSNTRVPGTHRPLVIHNVGAGPKEEDRLFAYPMTGHYRYHPRPHARRATPL